jgi:hypothetical protein
VLDGVTGVSSVLNMSSLNIEELNIPGISSSPVVYLALHHLHEVFQGGPHVTVVQVLVVLEFLYYRIDV